MITAFGRETEKTLARQEEINAFLNKPISQSTLFNAIMDVFGKEVYEEEKSKKPITTKASIYKNRLKGARILVAEDNPTNQEVAKAILEGAGIIVEIAENGEKAVQMARQGNFDAILMDIQMPKMDGCEATMAIRQDSKIQFIPIIAMTAHAMKGDQQMCINTGMDAYVSKPIRQDRLFEAIYKAIGPRTLSEEKHIDDEAVKTDVLPLKLPGINIEGALNASKIDGNVFKQILTGFFKNNKDTAKNIRDAFTAADWPTLSHISHSLKGSAGNIGAEELYDVASNVEAQSKQGVENPPDSTIIDKLESTLGQVLKSLESLVEKPGHELPEAKTIHIEPEKLLPMLKNMADALELADPEEIKVNFNNVKKYIDKQLMEKLENRINDYDYDNALKILKEVQERNNHKGDGSGKK
jgi:CheY-like chemotaxis protein